MIPSKDNNFINMTEDKQNKIEPKSNLIFSENDLQISGFNTNGNNVVENNNIKNINNNRNIPNSAKRSNKMSRSNNNEEMYNTYNNNIFNKNDNDINNVKYNYLLEVFSISLES